MVLEKFKVGETYAIRTKDWVSPLGERVPGRVIVRTIIQPARKSSRSGAPAFELKTWQEFLRVYDPERGIIHFLNPDTIEDAAIYKTGA